MDFNVFGYEITAWQFFASFGLLFMLLEVFAPGFVMLPIGVAAILTIPGAVLFSDWLTQMGIFGFNLVITFWVFIKFFKGKFINKEGYKSNVDSMVGQVGEVIEAFEGHGLGYVKLYGDQWQASSQDQGEYNLGDRVEIIGVQGNKVIVKRIVD